MNTKAGGKQPVSLAVAFLQEKENKTILQSCCDKSALIIIYLLCSNFFPLVQILFVIWSMITSEEKLVQQTPKMLAYFSRFKEGALINTLAMTSS